MGDVPGGTSTPDPLSEFRNAVLRIITYRSSNFGGLSGYLLSRKRVEEIVSEAHEYARSMAAAERGHMAAAVPPGILDALADWMARTGAEFDGPLAELDLPKQLKILADLLAGEGQ